MKKGLFLLILVLSVLLSVPVRSQSIAVDGYAFLIDQSDHSGIRVIFSRAEPAKYLDTVFTDLYGYYSAVVPKGVYQVFFSKSSYYSIPLNNVNINQDKRLDTVILSNEGVSGRIAGYFSKSDYIIEDSSWVEDKDTLTFQPGTRLFFKKGKGLNICGVFNAKGTEKDSIIFTRYLGEEDDPDSTYWKGIEIKNPLGSTNSDVYEAQMKYCSISYCNPAAVSISRRNTSIENSLFSNCTGMAALQVLYNKQYILRNLKIVDFISSNEGIGCIYLLNPSINHIIENIEITGMKTKNIPVFSFYGNNVDSSWNLKNLYIHDNNGSLLETNMGSASFINSTIVNNIDFGTRTGGANIKFVNCILANNTGGGFNCGILNSDFYNNGKNDSLDRAWVGINIRTNKNGDSCDTYGNITLPPGFVNEVNQDYSLAYGSPCIDAGENDAVVTAIDFLGRQRICDGNKDGEAFVDMGAFEYESTTGLVDYPIQPGYSVIRPNPAADYIIVPLINENSVPYPASIYNVYGEKILSLDNLQTSGIKIDISALPSGVYYLVRRSERGIEREKFVVSR